MRFRNSVLIALPLLLVSGCVISIGGKSSWLGGHWSNLDHEHVETLELRSNLSSLEVGTGSGDIHVQPANGSPRIIVTVREEEPGDGYAVLEGDALHVRSHTGQDVALGDVEVFLDGVAHELSLSTGSGNVILEHVGVDDSVMISTGSGDVVVRNVGELRRVVVYTGSGEISASGFDCRDLQMDTGSGDIDVRKVNAEAGSFDTGSGDVHVHESKLERVHADTGSGDIDVRGSEIRSRSFSTGSGDVRG